MSDGFDPAETWKCGSCSLSNDHVKYIVQVSFGFLIIAFSMVQIVRDDGDTTVYYSMLSGTMGLFLPAPTIKKQ